MKAVNKFVGLAIIWSVLLLVLGACGESSTTSQPAATSTTVNVSTTVAATTATLSTTIAATTATTSVATTTKATMTTIATTNPATATQNVAPVVPPTFTIGPTPQPAALMTSWAKDGVCYEIFVRSFFDSNGDGIGDLKGLISKLDYLNDGNPNSTKSLGVNCLWLMPITASPSYHGYDPTDYYKVNPDYGTNEDFKTLIQEAHKRGIYVITDMVFNHTSNQSDWFKQAASDPKSPYRDWYIFQPTDPGYKGPWGAQAWWQNPLGNGYYYAVFDKSQPDLNFRNPAVTKQMYDVTRFWLQDMGADGFRFDAAKHLIEDGPNQINTPETHAWWRDFHKFYTSLKPDAFTIGEVNGSSGELSGYYPDQLDDYFDFDLAQNFVSSANDGDAAFVTLTQSANTEWPLQRYGTFLTNHDQARVGSVLAGNNAKLKMAATAYLTMTGLPFVYYGEEIGMQGIKPDESIRTPLQWTGDIKNGGFTKGTPWEALDQSVATANVQTEDTDPNSLLNLYRKLIHLRRAHPALSQGEMLPVDHNQSGLATYLRHAGNEDVLVVLNMTGAEIQNPKLTVAQSQLASGQYIAQVLLDISNTAGKIAPLTVGDKGAVKDYAITANLPGHSGYILLLKKS